MAKPKQDLQSLEAKQGQKMIEIKTEVLDKRHRSGAWQDRSEARLVFWCSADRGQSLSWDQA